MNKDDERVVLEFLKSNKLATLATVNVDAVIPQSALIAFAELPSLELVFQTSEDSRKYQNLLANPAVALVVGWELQNYTTLQYEGAVTALSADEARQYHAAFLGKDSPTGEYFLNHPKSRFFRVKPTWLRYADYSCSTPLVIEHDFKRKETKAQPQPIRVQTSDASLTC